VDQQSIGGRLFHGTAGVLRPGDRLPPEAPCTNDPAEALVHAWTAAKEGVETPYVYEVGTGDGIGLTILRDVLIDGRLADQALGIAARRAANR
jgi:hypothetical protein